MTDVLRDGAQQMLAPPIEAEVDDDLAGRATTVDAAGRRYVVRNGHLPPRAIQTPLGDVQVQQPRVRDRRGAAVANRVTIAEALTMGKTIFEWAPEGPASLEFSTVMQEIGAFYEQENSDEAGPQQTPHV